MRESDKEVRRDVNCDEGLNPAKEGGKELGEGGLYALGPLQTGWWWSKGTGDFRGRGETGLWSGWGPRAICGRGSGIWGRDGEGCSGVVPASPTSVIDQGDGGC